MGARRYGISLQVFNSIAHEWAHYFNVKTEMWLVSVMFSK